MNTFQTVIATDGISTYVMLNYGDIQWGTDATTVGFNAGDQIRFYTLPESSSNNGILNLESTSNIGRPGTYVFRVDQDSIIPLNGQ